MEMKWVVNGTNSVLRDNICMLPPRVTGWALGSKAMLRCDRDRRKDKMYILPLRRWAAATRMQRVYRWLALTCVVDFRLLCAEQNALTLTTTHGLYLTWWSEFQIASLYREKLHSEHSNTAQETTALIRVVWLDYNWI